MLSIFCSHDYANVGTGMDDLWKCRHCGKITDRNPSYRTAFMCSHDWRPYSAGMDDLKQCTKCGIVKEAKPGDFAPW